MNKHKDHITDASTMEELKQAVISKIHGLPWEEARLIEARSSECCYDFYNEFAVGNWITNVRARRGGCVWLTAEELTKRGVVHKGEGLYNCRFQNLSPEPKSGYKIVGQPITLSRVLQALVNLNKYHVSHDTKLNCIHIIDQDTGLVDYAIDWVLLKEDKSTATLEDQSKETIEALKTIFL